MPTNVLSGSASAIGIRLPPLAQPSSRTRQRSGAAGSRPNSVATVASRSGCVWANGWLGYGNKSYVLLNDSGFMAFIPWSIALAPPLKNRRPRFIQSSVPNLPLFADKFVDSLRLRRRAPLCLPVCEKMAELRKVVASGGVLRESAFFRAHQSDSAWPAAAQSHRPGGVGGVRRALRSQDLRLVPEVGPARSGCRGSDPGRAGQAGRKDARLRLRSDAPLPKLAQDGDAQRLVQLSRRPQRRGDRQRRQPSARVAANRRGPRRSGGST